MEGTKRGEREREREKEAGARRVLNLFMNSFNRFLRVAGLGYLVF